VHCIPSFVVSNSNFFSHCSDYYRSDVIAECSEHWSSEAEACRIHQYVTFMPLSQLLNYIKSSNLNRFSYSVIDATSMHRMQWFGLVSKMASDRLRARLPVQVIAWKDSSPKWHVVCRAGC